MGQPLTLPTPTIETGTVSAPAADVAPVRGRRQASLRRRRPDRPRRRRRLRLRAPRLPRRDGKTRFLSIWDQGGNTRPSPAERRTAPFNYGAELVGRRPQRGDRRRRRARACPRTCWSRSRRCPPAPTARTSRASRRGTAGVCRARADRGGPDRDSAGRARPPRGRSTTRRGSPTRSTTCSPSPSARGSRSRSTSASARTATRTTTRARSPAGSTRRSRARAAASASRPGNAGQERAEHEDDTGWILGRVHSERPHRGARARARHRVERRRQRDRRPLRERARDLVRRPGPLRGAGQAAERRVDRGRSAVRVHREPPARGRLLPQRLQRALPPRERREPDRHLPEPAAAARPRSSASGRAVADPADRRRGARRALPLLDRAGRPAPRRPDRRA